MKINVGLIGFGAAAQTFHLPLLSVLSEYQITGFCSSQRERLAADWPGALIVSDVHSLVSRKDIELVIVTSPSGLHFEHAKAALSAGKHVVIEKPFSLNQKQAIALIALAREKKRLLTVFQNRRWDGDFITLKNLIANNTLGKIHVFESHFDRYRPHVRERWREQSGPGSGILYDLGPHLIDQAIQLFGMPQTVFASLDKQRDGATTDDYMHVVMSCNNVQVILHADMLNAAPNSRFRLQGDKGTYVIAGLDPQENQLKQGISPLAPQFGLHGKEDNDLSNYGRLFTETECEKVQTAKGNYLAFYQQLARSILHNAPAPVTYDSALQVTTVIDWIHESHRQQRTLHVELSE